MGLAEHHLGESVVFKSILGLSLAMLNQIYDPAHKNQLLLRMQVCVCATYPTLTLSLCLTTSNHQRLFAQKLCFS